MQVSYSLVAERSSPSRVAGHDVKSIYNEPGFTGIMSMVFVRCGDVIHPVAAYLH